MPLALGQTIGVATLFGASIGASLIKGWAGSSLLLRRVVPVSTLDLIFAGRFSQERSLIKIDVEGAEYPLLQGGKSPLNLDPAPIWIAEIALGGSHPGGYNPRFREIFDLFLR